jgi:hypothetical protein
VNPSVLPFVLEESHKFVRCTKKLTEFVYNFFLKLLFLLLLAAATQLKFHYTPNAFRMNTERDCPHVNFSILSSLWPWFSCYFCYLLGELRWYVLGWKA